MVWDGTKWVGKQYLEGIKDGYKLATHDTTKKVVKKTGGMVWDGTKWVGKQYLEGTKLSLKGLKWVSKKGYNLFKNTKSTNKDKDE